jgi:hypothetical protein
VRARAALAFTLCPTSTPKVRVPDQAMNDTSKSCPSMETLQQQLQIQWQDHFQTRAQTWNSLQIEAALFLAVIGADIKLNDPWLLIPLGGILFVSTIFGISITIHHRKVQIQKFQFIYMLEEKLCLHQDGYMEGATEPAPFKWAEIFDVKKIATPTFILVMHLLILIFGVMYIAVRIAGITIA